MPRIVTSSNADGARPPFALIDFDGSVDLGVEPKARHVAHRAGDQEEGQRDDRHVTEVEQHGNEGVHI